MKSAEEIIAEQATGCQNAGGYRKWAEAQGYPHCEVLDWTSSAGNWQFLVSKDGNEWFLMDQTNNWPRAGFTRTIDQTQVFWGTIEEVYQQIEDMFS